MPQTQHFLSCLFSRSVRVSLHRQAEACYSVMGVPYEHVSEMTGASLGQAKRAAEWRDKRCFFVTPHIVQNDINRGTLKAEDIVCLVVDEAHKAVSNYAFVNVVRAVAGAYCDKQLSCLCACCWSWRYSQHILTDGTFV